MTQESDVIAETKASSRSAMLEAYCPDQVFLTWGASIPRGVEINFRGRWEGQR